MNELALTMMYIEVVYFIEMAFNVFIMYFVFFLYFLVSWILMDIACFEIKCFTSLPKDKNRVGQANGE